MRNLRWMIWPCWLALWLPAACALAQGAPPTSGPDRPVTREEYDALLKELAAMKSQVQSIEAKAESRDVEQKLYFQNFELEMARIRQVAEGRKTFGTEFLFTGDIESGFTNAAKGSHSSFDASFAPVILWRLNERLLVEVGLDIGLVNDPNGENADTEVELAQANITYAVCNYLAVGAGKFTTPFGIYHPHLDLSWINKFPDDPLPFGDGGIAPDTSVGVFATGAIPIGRTKFNYSIYVENGPTLLTDDPDSAGSLSFDNFNDTNNNKAVGGRFGFQPLPELEFGYSIMCSQVNPETFPTTVHALIQGVDANYVKEIKPIGGQLTARAEWVWSHVGDATYGPNEDPAFGPLRFKNDRNGGYVLLAYRPTKATCKVLRDFEFALRYDRLEIPSNAPGGGREQRWTPGIVYWVTPRTAIKAAYEFDDSDSSQTHVMLLQFATGL